MKKYRNLLFYISVIGIFSAIIYLFLRMGGQESADSKTIESLMMDQDYWTAFIKNLTKGIFSPLPTLLLQIVVILLAVRILGWVCQKIGQPSVIGEIIAGVMLGPSLLGAYFPDTFEFLFPVSSFGGIELLSQIGLILFMFIVGMELDLKTIKSKANNALIISHIGIIIPFSLGVILSYYLYGEFTYEDTEFLPFALFMGIAMSIAAFPVMARIIHERGINKTPMGAVIITCAAMDDITAWCLLAGVIAIANAGSLTSSFFVILLAIIYIIFMFKIVRPFLKQVVEFRTSSRSLSRSIVAIFFLVLFLSAYATEVIGIHALFGAFLAGVIMPSNLNFRTMFTEKIEDVSLTLFLPLFFVFTGLRTEIGLLNDPYLWKLCAFIILLAVTGKLFGSALAARFVGNSWKDSLTIGALMNTRGLMELVVLNIGLDLGILTPRIFAMMVVMALVTTFMTSPTLNFIDWIFRKQPDKNTEEDKKYKILISFKAPNTGKQLLRIASCFVKNKASKSEVTLVHFSEGRALYQSSLDIEEKQMFAPALKEAKLLDVPTETIFNVSGNAYTDVARTANKGNYDLLLIGFRGSIHSRNVLGRLLGIPSGLIHVPDMLSSKFSKTKKWFKTLRVPVLDEGSRAIINRSDMPVGIFIDRGLVEIKNIFILVLDEDDLFMGNFMKRIFDNSNVRVTLWDRASLADSAIEFVNIIRDMKSSNPYLFQLWNNNIPIDSDILAKQDLIMLSSNSWKTLHEEEPIWYKDIPSTLIICDNFY